MNTETTTGAGPVDQRVRPHARTVANHIEQRLRTWRQQHMNRSGDRLALDDFMGEDSIADLVDFVCDEYALDAVLASAVAAERERWQQVAKSVIESHDAALAYVYERLRSQGVGSITIPDSAVAEIRAVNALRELVQPNTKITGPQGPVHR